MASLFCNRPFSWHHTWRSTTALSDNNMGLQDTNPCMICHVPVGTETPDGEVETWSALPCGHRFGSYCVKRWLGFADQPACPICRTPMLHVCGHPVLPVPLLSGGGSRQADDQETEVAVGSIGDISGSSGSSQKSSDSEPSTRKSSSSHGSHHSHLSRRASLIMKPFLSQGASSSSSSSSLASSAVSASSHASEDPKPAPTKRSLSNLLRRRRLSVPGSSSQPTRTAPDTQIPCDYCAMSMLKLRHHFSDGAPASIMRSAVSFFSHHSHSSSHTSSQSNWENAYWERWRKDHGKAFGKWWAAQQPPTEPARELPTQGWVL